MIRRPAVTITEENAYVLQLLDCLKDIDITFDEHIGEARRKKLKHVVLKGISEELCMPISNWNDTESDKDYNAYLFTYQSVWKIEGDRMLPSVKLETALGSYAFPTKIVPINSYIGDYFIKKERADFANRFMLDVFNMKLQSIERTYIDKIFALCDYYVQGKSKRYSRHLYDIYKLTNKIDVANALSNLYNEIKVHRKQMKNCQSAQDGEDVSGLINAFCDEDFYKNDYQEITNYFSDDYVAYEDTIKQMRKLAKMIKEVT